MDIKSHSHDIEGSLILKGRFDFNVHRDFKNAYMPFLEEKKVRTIAVDLKDVSYMDSSSMGMLLVFRERAEPLGIKIKLLCGDNKVVRDLLAVVSFHKIFEIL